MFDFPNNPTKGQTTNNNGIIYQWDSTKWVTTSGPANVPLPSTTLPIMDGAATIGSLITYAKADHIHPSNTSIASSTTPIMDGIATVGTALTWARADHIHPSDTSIASNTTPLMDGTATIGNALTWARANHIHPTDTSRYAASNPSGYQTAAQVSSTVSAYLPLAGGTITGSLTVNNRTTTNDMMNVSGIFYVANNYAYYLQRSSSDGQWRFVDNNNILFRIDTGGNIFSTGYVMATANVYSHGNNYYFSDNGANAAINWNGSAIAFYAPYCDVHASFHVYSSETIDGTSTIQQGVYTNANGVNWGTGCSYGTGSWFSFGWAWYDSCVRCSIGNGGAVVDFANASDARAKYDIAPSTYNCLDTVLKMPLHEFRWLHVHEPNDLKSARKRGEPLKRVGFIAQEVNKVFPEGVMPGDDFEDKLGRLWQIETSCMLALLVGAVQQLSAKLEALDR